MSFSPTGDEDMVSDVSVISVGQESGENGGKSEQNSCQNHRLVENAFMHTDGILGQTRMVLAKQCQNKSLPCEILKHTDKDILQSNQTKKSMVAKLISFFSFKKSDSSSNLLIKTNEKSTQKTDSGSLVIVESGSVQQGKKDETIEGNTPQQVDFQPEFARQPKEATVTVKKEIKIDINISMTSAVTTTVTTETNQSKSNTSESNTCINILHSSECFTEKDSMNDNFKGNSLNHATDTHISNFPPAENHFCRDTKDKIIHNCPKTRSHCMDEAPSEHLSKPNISNDNISDTALNKKQSNNGHITENKEVTESVHSVKRSVSKDHISTTITLTGLSEVKENKSKTTIENVHFDPDLESNTIKKTDNANNAVQRDNDENNVTDENASGMPRTNAIDNTTNSIPNQKAPNDEYVDLPISEKTEGTNKSNVLARSEKITNNQSCFSSVSAKPSDKSLIIESGSFLQTATCKTLPSSTDKANVTQNQGHFTDNVFLSHRLLQNQVRVLDTSNYYNVNTSEEKSDVSGGCTSNEKEKPLHLSANTTYIDRGNNPLDNTDKSDNTDGKVNAYFSDHQSCNIKESSNEENISPIKSQQITLPKPYLLNSVNDVFSQMDNTSRDASNEIPIPYSGDPLNLQKSNTSYAFESQSSCIPNTMPPLSHFIGKPVFDMKSHNCNDETTSQLENSHSSMNSMYKQTFDSKSYESENKQYHSKQNDLCEIKPNEFSENVKITKTGSLELRELKCDIPQRINTLPSDIKYTNKKPLVLNRIIANSDLLKQRKTPRGSKPLDVVIAVKQKDQQQRQLVNVSTKTKETLEENVQKTQPHDEKKEDDTESNLVSNFEFSESLDSSSEEEAIRVEEFSVDDTEDDTWSLATFAMPTKLEMDQKEEDIPLNYYKRKRYKKKTKGYIKQFYREARDKSQDINEMDLKKPVNLPFLNSHIKDKSTSVEDSSSKKKFDEIKEDTKTHNSNNIIDSTETYSDVRREKTKIEDKTKSETLQIRTDDKDKGKTSKTKEDYKRNTDKNTRKKVEQEKTRQLSQKSMKCEIGESVNQNTVEHMESNESCKLQATDKVIKDNVISNSVPQVTESSKCITLRNGEKSKTLPEIHFKENNDVSFVSLPDSDIHQKVKQNNKTTKTSSLLSKAESMSLPSVEVKKAFSVSESGTKLKSQQKESTRTTKETKSKTSSSKVDKASLKKKAKKTKTTKFSRNITFKVSNEDKPVVENYDKFGEREETLREEKPNKFRFDQLPTIRKSKAKEKPQATKKPQKCLTKGNENIDESEKLHEELKLPNVGNNVPSEKQSDGTCKPLEKDHVIIGADEGQGKLVQAKEKKGVSQKKTKKKRKKKKVQQTKEFSSDIDSDDEIEIDPSVYFTTRAGNSSRPASSHELPQLINKIKLTASCTDIRSLCGDID